MSRRRVFCLLGMLIVAAVFLSWYFSHPSAPRRQLAHENFKSIHKGMSQAEVEELLGGPPGNYGRYVSGGSLMTCEGYIYPPGSIEKIWCDDSNRFEIYFNTSGSVVGLHRRASYQQSPPESFFAYLWRSIRRLW